MSADWKPVEKLARSKGYDLESMWLSSVKVYYLRRLNWKSRLYTKPEGLEKFLQEKAIDHGSGYIP